MTHFMKTRPKLAIFQFKFIKIYKNNIKHHKINKIDLSPMIFNISNKMIKLHKITKMTTFDQNRQKSGYIPILK